MIRESSIKNAPLNNEIKIEGNEKRRIPKGLMPVPFTILVCGKKGAGKSHAIANLFRKYQSVKKCPAFDPPNIFVCSPTHGLDPTQSLITAEPDNVYDTKDGLDEPILEIQDKIKEDLDDYDDYLERLNAWKAFQKWDQDLGLFPPDELLKIYDPLTETIMKPETDYPCGKPSSLIYIDDQVGSGGLSGRDNVLTNFSIKHRHYNTSVIYLIQHYKSISRAIRGNVSIIMLFKTHDQSVLDEIAKEVAGEVSQEDFMKLYHYATKKPYNFLLISLGAADKDNKFRMNFNTKLTIH